SSVKISEVCWKTLVNKQHLKDQGTQQTDLLRNCRDPQLRWENLFTRQLLLVHSTYLAFIEERAD
ncbi:hypothetical protein ILYODFUR_021061, partial [Ilyodon furcidens]